MIGFLFFNFKNMASYVIKRKTYSWIPGGGNFARAFNCGGDANDVITGKPLQNN